MTLVRGESYGLGVANETVRNTFVTAQDYIRTREPISAQTKVEKVDIKETKLTGMSSQGQVLTRTVVEGEAAFNMRFRTIGYILKSLLGGCSSATEAGETVVYRHTFTLDPLVLQPTMSLSLARGAFTHRQVPGAIFSKLGFIFPVDDVVNCKASLMGRVETDTSNFTPAFAANDYLAPHQMVTIKQATNVAGLGAATAMVLTEADLELDRDARGKASISSVNYVDFISKLLKVSGSLTFEKDDEVLRGFAVANTARAMSFTITNTAQTIGVGSNPSLTITLPHVTFMAEESGSLDDVVTEKVNFVANYDDTLAYGITVSLVNEKANYN